MDAQRFLDSISKRISSVSDDPREETTFLYQRLLVQIFNLIAFRGTFVAETVIEG